jgi:predicted nucleotide-binding protein
VPVVNGAGSSARSARGHTGISPIARYLLHAAKLLHELRVWPRDSQSRPLRATLDSLGAELRRSDASDPGREALLQLRRRDALVLHADLRALRRTVEIAVDNLGQALDLSGLLDRGMPFADDADLARSLLHRLDDEISCQLAEPSAVRSHQPGPAVTPLRRDVFVVYGRDDAARRAIFDFLRALDLRPLEWEALVRGAGSTAPFLSEAARKGIELASAVVVLMTPEDIVQLHPELHEPREAGAEVGTTMQARPNVLVELGMALAAKPAGTLVLMLGEQRPVTDLGGIDFIRVIDTPQCRRKIAGRLRQAGCSVDDADGDWLTAGDFANLAALRRVP